MNISSAIAYAKKGKEAADVAKKIDKIEGCEVVAAQEGKIVVVMSAENLDGEIELFKILESVEGDEEINRFKTLERLEGVSGAAMIYSYQEDLQKDVESIKKSGKISEILFDENIDAKDIVYNGNIGDRAK